MKKFLPIRTLACLFLLSIFIGCNYEEFEPPQWELDMIGPIANTVLTLNDVADLGTLSASSSISIAELGIPEGDYAFLPAISDASIGPLTSTFSEFSEASLIEGDITFIITNNFPITLEAGAILSLESGGETLFTHTIPVAIEKNGGTYTPDSGFDLAGKIIYDVINVNITSISTLTITDGVSIDNSQTASINYEIENTAFEEVRIKENPDFTGSEFSSINLEGSEIDIAEASGDLILEVDNGMPVSYRVQVAFYDETQSTELAILFDEGAQNIPAAPTNANGEATATSSITLTANISASEYEAIRESAYILTIFTSNTLEGNETVLLTSEDEVAAKLIGDLNIIVNE